jgi:hypothetical protein
MADQPQQPEVIDPDNVPETLCEGMFNISFTGPLAVRSRIFARRPATVHRDSKPQIDSTIPHCDFRS